MMINDEITLYDLLINFMSRLIRDGRVGVFIRLDKRIMRPDKHMYGILMPYL